jgi:hypothetical protein
VERGALVAMYFPRFVELKATMSRYRAHCHPMRVSSQAEARPRFLRARSEQRAPELRQSDG